MKEESDNASEGKCPFGFSDKNQVPNTGFSNSKWWPNQLNLKILHQNSALTNPMSNDFNYKDEFNLGELDKHNIHTFITEMRNRCVWNEQKWDQFHHPLHYITFNPGDIWFFNAQWITHQIVFGTKLQCFEADILNESLIKPELCMVERIKNL